MKLIIDIPEMLKNAIDNHKNYDLIDSAIAVDCIRNGTPIPDNATNGEVLMMMFPPSEYMNDEWWNAPYQKGGKE